MNSLCIQSPPLQNTYIISSVVVYIVITVYTSVKYASFSSTLTLLVILSSLPVSILLLLTIIYNKSFKLQLTLRTAMCTIQSAVMVSLYSHANTQVFHQLPLVHMLIYSHHFDIVSQCMMLSTCISYIVSTYDRQHSYTILYMYIVDTVIYVVLYIVSCFKAKQPQVVIQTISSNKSIIKQTHRSTYEHIDNHNVFKIDIYNHLNNKNVKISDHRSDASSTRRKIVESSRQTTGRNINIPGSRSLSFGRENLSDYGRNDVLFDIERLRRSESMDTERYKSMRHLSKER